MKWVKENYKDVIILLLLVIIVAGFLYYQQEDKMTSAELADIKERCLDEAQQLANERSFTSEALQSGERWNLEKMVYDRERQSCFECSCLPPTGRSLSPVGGMRVTAL